jgi:hypothetical protein
VIHPQLPIFCWRCKQRQPVYDNAVTVSWSPAIPKG